MSARIYWADAWRQARDQRAKSGKAPRLALRRSIQLREVLPGEWAVAICTWHFGRWKQPEWICGRTTLLRARTAALAAREERGLPVFWFYEGENRLRPFHPGFHEPREARA